MESVLNLFKSYSNNNKEELLNILVGYAAARRPRRCTRACPAAASRLAEINGTLLGGEVKRVRVIIFENTALTSSQI